MALSWQRRTRPQNLHPKRRSHWLLPIHLQGPFLTSPPGTATLRADRVVGGVPGHIADIGEALLSWGVRGDASEGILAHVPLPLDDVQEQRHVPLFVKEELVAQEGELDLPDLPE